MAAILCWLLHSWEGAAQTPPSPRILSPTQGDTADPSLTITSDASSSTGEDDASEAADNGFPTVDWAYWQGVNPDVIGGSPCRAPPSIPPSCRPPRMTRTSISATTCTGTTTSTEPYISTRNASKQGWTAATRSFSATILGIWKPRPSASSKNTRTKPSRRARHNPSSDSGVETGLRGAVRADRQRSGTIQENRLPQ